MRYVFVSDIHGNYDKLRTALKKAHFKPKKDTLVSLGDPFDRGTQNLEVLKFLMSCPNRILVAGNHDLRLKYILLGMDRFNRYDRMNGLDETLHDFCNKDNIYGPGTLIMALKTCECYKENYKLLWQYFDECVYGLEWDDLIAVHGWIPTTEVIVNNRIIGHEFNPDWRQAGDYDWYEATWSQTEKMIGNNLFPEKKMVIGHWCACRLWAMYWGNTLEAQRNAPYTTFATDKFIAIDGCTIAEEGLVNTFIYNSDKEPIYYDRQKIRSLK